MSTTGMIKVSAGCPTFDGPESMPQNVIYYVWQILKVLKKEFLWIFSALGPRLHHAKHLAHESALYRLEGGE